MFEQNLPTYIHAFESDTRWKTRGSDRYLFHYFSSSEAEKDLGTIVRTQEAAYAKILGELQLPDPGRKIEYFFYPDSATKAALMGDDWYAQAIYNEFRVHVLYTEKDKPTGPHEDTHLLSLPWGLSIGFLQEGLAEYMVGRAWDGTAHRKYALMGYQNGIFPPLVQLMSHKTWKDSGEDGSALQWYSLAGSFTAYLIETFGKDKFERLYRGTAREKSEAENSDVFSSVYGKGIGDIEKEFRSWLKK